MTIWKTPPELVKLGKAVVKYFDEVNRALSSSSSGSQTVPIGWLVVVPPGLAAATIYGAGTYLLCNGTTIYNVDYPDLFEAWGISGSADRALPTLSATWVRAA